MRVAVYSSNLEWKCYMESCFRLCREVVEPLEVDFLSTEQDFRSAVRARRYALIFIYGSIKPKVSQGVFLNALGRLRQEALRDSSRCVWQFGPKIVVLEEWEIYYIYSCQKAVSVHTSKTRHRISTSMKQEGERFSGKQFVRIHRNCLVNLSHVKNIEGTCMELDNGEMLDISVRRRSQVVEEFLRFHSEKGRRRKG